VGTAINMSAAGPAPAIDIGDTRQLLVLATGAASGIWLVSNIFIYEIGRSIFIVDELPEGGLSMWLFSIGVLRPRRQTEQYPKMLFVEKVMFGLSVLSIILGMSNFVSAYQCTSFSAQMKRQTCQYSRAMAEKCEGFQASCIDTACGGANFTSCGVRDLCESYPSRVGMRHGTAC
jgi:hypothetical protein